MPVLKPNEAMIEQAAARGRKIGLLSTFAPTLASMPPEFPPSVELVPKLAEGALAALDRGDRRPMTLVVEAPEICATATSSRLRNTAWRQRPSGRRGDRAAGADDARQRGTETEENACHRPHLGSGC